MTLPERLRAHADAHEYISDADDEQRQWIADLHEAAALIEALNVADDEVLVALKRPEDEEAVNPNWPEYRVVWPLDWPD